MKKKTKNERTKKQTKKQKTRHASCVPCVTTHGLMQAASSIGHDSIIIKSQLRRLIYDNQ